MASNGLLLETQASEAADGGESLRRERSRSEREHTPFPAPPRRAGDLQRAAELLGELRAGKP
eukprot:549810-Prorocentrum_minimum.AAC.4